MCHTYAQTFTGWVKHHLQKRSIPFSNIILDFQDGIKLIALLEILSGDKLPMPENGSTRVHCINNVNAALAFLKSRRVPMGAVLASQIVDGDRKIILGLLWTLILHYDVRLLHFSDSQQEYRSERALLRWAQTRAAAAAVPVNNLHSSWLDGLALAAVLQYYYPGQIAVETLDAENPARNFELCFDVARTNGLDIGITGREFLESGSRPDARSLLVLITSFFRSLEHQEESIIEDADELLEAATAQSVASVNTTFDQSNKFHHLQDLFNTADGDGDGHIPLSDLAVLLRDIITSESSVPPSPRTGRRGTFSRTLRARDASRSRPPFGLSIEQLTDALNELLDSPPGAVVDFEQFASVTKDLFDDSGKPCFGRSALTALCRGLERRCAELAESLAVAEQSAADAQAALDAKEHEYRARLEQAAEGGDAALAQAEAAARQAGEEARRARAQLKDLHESKALLEEELRHARATATSSKVSADADRLIAMLRADVDRLRAERDKALHDCESARASAEASTTAMNSQLQRYQASSAQLDRSLATIAAERQRIAALEQANAELLNQVRELRAQLAERPHRAKRPSLLAETRDAERAGQSMASELAEAQGTSANPELVLENETLQRKLAMAAADLDQARKEIELQSGALNATKEALTKSQVHLTEREAWVRSLEASVAAQRDELAARDELVRRLQQQLSAEQRRPSITTPRRVLPTPIVVAPPRRDLVDKYVQTMPLSPPPAAPAHITPSPLPPFTLDPAATRGVPESSPYPPPPAPAAAAAAASYPSTPYAAPQPARQAGPTFSSRPTPYEAAQQAATVHQDLPHPDGSMHTVVYRDMGAGRVIVYDHEGWRQATFALQKLVAKLEEEIERLKAEGRVPGPAGTVSLPPQSHAVIEQYAPVVEDELRRALDSVMAVHGATRVQLDICRQVVHHVRKPDGRYVTVPQAELHDRHTWFATDDVRELRLDAWTPAEDDTIVAAHSRFGPKWAEIARLVPGRTDVSVHARCEQLLGDAPVARQASPEKAYKDRGWAEGADDEWGSEEDQDDARFDDNEDGDEQYEPPAEATLMAAWDPSDPYMQHIAMLRGVLNAGAAKQGKMRV